MEPILLSEKMPNLHLDITSSHSNSFGVMHWQCEGNLKIENNKLIIDDSEFNSKALQFIKLAKTQNAALALTPEYSFPWELIDTIINDSALQPAEGKLWCFGMQYKLLSDYEQWCLNHQSLTTEEFAAGVRPKDRSTVIIFDGFLEKKVFANVLAYVFLNADKHLTILLQSKLAHMNDQLYEFEASDLSLGKYIYLFDYGDFQTKAFCTLICADAMEHIYYHEIESKLPGRQVLMFHPQLNRNPFHPDILKHVNVYVDSKWSFLRLNWSFDTKLLGDSLKTLGTGYIYKSDGNVKKYWQDDSQRKNYVMNRSKRLNLLMNQSLRCQWIFPRNELIAYYFLKHPKAQATASSAAYELGIKEIYIYRNDWIAESICPLSEFRQLISQPSTLLDSFIKALDCEVCNDQARKVCALLFYDRFASLFQGKEDYEVILEINANGFINGCITSIMTPDLKRNVIAEFDKINKIAIYLEDIISHSQNSADNNIKELKNLVPDGVHLDIAKVFPQNSVSMYNAVGNPLSRHGSLQKGLVVYTKDTTTPELKFQLTQCKAKTEVQQLGVMLFYPNGDDAVKLYPNPDWSYSADAGMHGASSKSMSDIGIGGGADD